MSPSVTSRQLLDLCSKIFEKAGLEPEDALSVASLLVDAERRGMQSHGVNRVTQYVNNLSAGGAKPHPDIRILSETETTAVIDADCSLGAVSSELAVRIAREKARAHGIGYVTVKNCSHFGMGAHWTLKLAGDDMIGFTGSTTNPSMAAPGGINAVVGNNPFGIGLNGEKYKEIAIDQACSISAKGRAVMMAKQGMEIPMGWFLDENGEPTNDLSKVSTMVPMAAHKGYGIAFGIEVLSGFLSGGALPQNMNSQADPQSCELANQFFAAVNISFFRDPADFKKSLDEYIDWIKLSKLKAGVDSVKYPGEIEHDASVRAEKEGIRLPDPVARDLIGHAVKFGLEPSDYAFLQ